MTPGLGLSGDLGGSPAPEIVNPSIDQYLAKTGWDIVAEDAAFRRCSENLDDNDRLGTKYGGPNTTRSDHTGVDIQANDGALSTRGRAEGSVPIQQASAARTASRSSTLTGA